MSSFISSKEARAMMDAYRKIRDLILQAGYQGKDVLSISETFDREQIEILFAKPGCEYLRVYYGMDANSRVHAILVAADAEGRDIISDTPAITGVQTTAATGLSTDPTTDPNDTIEEGRRCPPDCPPPSGFYP